MSILAIILAIAAYLLLCSLLVSSLFPTLFHASGEGSENLGRVLSIVAALLLIMSAFIYIILLL